MKKELDEKLVKTFPLLYKDRFASMQRTCMCWGFDVQDGWFQLIWDASAKLEPLIEQWIKDNEPVPCICGDLKDAHSNNGECINLIRDAYRLKMPWGNGWTHLAHDKSKGYTFKKFKFKVVSPLVRGFVKHANQFLRFLFKNFNVQHVTPCPCKRYVASHPCASQVKEKFGTLRMYLDWSTDEMEDIVDEAEAKSAVTCANCGHVGQLRGGGWLLTLCDKCAISKDGSVRPLFDHKEPM